jgi:PKD repeat protein
MNKILLFIFVVSLQQVAFSQNHLQKPHQEKALNDTIIFDINQAVYSNAGGINYIEFPVILKSSNLAINSFDFWFQFDLNKMTYESTTSLITGLDAFSNYNATNFYLSNTSSGTSITFNMPLNIPVIKLKFVLATACTEITANDFSNVTTLFDGDVSSYKFVAPTEQPIQLVSPDPLCTHNFIGFTYPSTIYGQAITAYQWNFGNGDLSTQQTDSTQYVQGAYTVSLNVTTTDGCTHTLNRDVTILEGPQAAFSAVYDAGQNAQVFTDQSTILSGNINQYEWNYGDASPNEFIQNPTHSYQNAGSYLVTLTVTSDNGCSNSYDSIVSSSDGIFELDFYSMALSPNPSMENCQIVADRYFVGTMIIENMNGQVVCERSVQGSQFPVDLTSYAKGTYVVKMTNQIGQKSFKVIKM